MFSMTLKIATVPFRVQVLHKETVDLCKDYLSLEEPCFTIRITQQRIEREREIIKKLEKKSGNNLNSYSDAEMEFNALYRETAEHLSLYDTVLIHGSAIGAQGKAFIFIAPSGTGKSTHTRLWRECFGESVIMINDDKPLIKILDDNIYVCGSPWNGKHCIGNNIMLPLKAVCFLSRGEQNSIEPISRDLAYLKLLKSIYHSENVASGTAVLKSLEKLYKKVSFYRLFCNMQKDAAEISYKGMVNDVSGNE